MIEKLLKFLLNCILVCTGYTIIDNSKRSESDRNSKQSLYCGTMEPYATTLVHLIEKLSTERYDIFDNISLFVNEYVTKLACSFCSLK